MRSRDRVWLLAICTLLLVPWAQGQFIGDALAAAGASVTEEQAIAVVGSLRGATAPAGGGTMESKSPQSATVTDPASLGKDVGIRRPRSEGGTVATGSSSTTGSKPRATSTTSISQPQLGGSSGFAGARLQAETIDQSDLAAWQSAMNSIGVRMPTLPDTTITVSVDGQTYHYDKGVFYEKRGSGFIATAAPVGAPIPQKPLGASTVFANGKPHIYYYGAFYVYDSVQKAFVVVAPPAGALIEYLPDSARKVEWSGAVHYQYGGSYYKPYYRGSKLVFVVAG